MRRAFGILTAVVVVLGGCSAEPRVDDLGEPALGPMVAVTDVNDLVLPLDSYEMVPANLPNSVRAEPVLLDRCLQRFGLRLPDMTPRKSTQPERRLFGLTDAQAAASRGYHATPVQPEQAPPAPFPPQVQAVLEGEGRRSYGGVRVPAGGCRAEAPAGGCRAEAMRELSTGAPWTTQERLATSLGAESQDRARRDSRVVAAIGRWSACMSRGGHDYREPAHASSDPVFATPEPTAQEIVVASADVQCKKDVGLVDLWATVLSAYQDRAMDTNREALDVVRSIITTRERNAASILAGP